MITQYVVYLNDIFYNNVKIKSDSVYPVQNIDFSSISLHKHVLFWKI